MGVLICGFLLYKKTKMENVCQVDKSRRQGDNYSSVAQDRHE